MNQQTIKFCGITSTTDARNAASAGANYLGLIRAPSPRRATIAVANEIARGIAGETEAVLLYQNAPLDNMIEELTETEIGWVQLHGDEPRTTIDKLRQKLPNLRVIRAWPLGTENDTDGLLKYLAENSVSLPDVVILDAEKGAKLPAAAEFLAAAKIVRDAGILVWRAGGLTCENIAAARTEYDYDGFDVARGVESAPGIKDREKMNRFVERVRL